MEAVAAEARPARRRTGEHLKPYHWQKGASGNPNGRPKSQDGITDMARSASPAVLQRLIDMALGKIDVKPEVAVRAAEAVLNRAYGLPKQSVDVNQVQQSFVAVLPMPIADAEAWAAKAAELNGRTIEHQEFQPASVVEMPSEDTVSSSNHYKD